LDYANIKQAPLKRISAQTCDLALLEFCIQTTGSSKINNQQDRCARERIAATEAFADERRRRSLFKGTATTTATSAGVCGIRMSLHYFTGSNRLHCIDSIVLFNFKTISVQNIHAKLIKMKHRLV
jgi:hypothetical protein